jgi:hypothetical protein
MTSYKGVSTNYVMTKKSKLLNFGKEKPKFPTVNRVYDIDN